MRNYDLGLIAKAVELIDQRSGVVVDKNIQVKAVAILIGAMDYKPAIAPHPDWLLDDYVLAIENELYGLAGFEPAPIPDYANWLEYGVYTGLLSSTVCFEIPIKLRPDKTRLANRFIIDWVTLPERLKLGEVSIMEPTRGFPVILKEAKVVETARETYVQIVVSYAESDGYILQPVKVPVLGSVFKGKPPY